MQRIRLFRNDGLERLTVISPVAFVLIWSVVLPLIAWDGFGVTGVMMATVLVLNGLIAWTLFEYVMHRYLFHWGLDWRPVQWFVFLIHGNHHAAPNDRMRNLMPPVISLPVAALIWGGFVTAFGPIASWFVLGFLLGYVIYDLVHFACHQWPMRGRLGMALKRHHMRHHHVNDDGNFAISAIFWDRVFGTAITSCKR